MVIRQFRVVWTKQAERHLRKIYEYISLDSPKNALKVVNDLAECMDKTFGNPEVYPIDKYKLDNDGTFRAFEKHKYRLSYRYSKDIIRVLRVKHTKMLPKYY